MSQAQFGPFQLMEPLGSGGFGTVYRAWDHQAGRYVALKILDEEIAWKPRDQERFRREIESARRLHHRHIVRVYGAGVIDNRGYLSMRLVEGGTVADLMQGHRPLDADRSTRIVRHIAGALDYAHSREVIHRDVKPANILIDQSGTAFLTDFGLARVRGMLTITRGGDVIGSVLYMSPEQVKGLRNATRASDIYALGVVLYEMMTGYAPFSNLSTTTAMLYAIVHQPPPDPRTLNSQIAARVAGVLMRALEKTPERRYPTAGALASAFQKAITTEEAFLPVPVSVPRQRSRPRRPDRRRMSGKGKTGNQTAWILIGLVALLLFLLALAGR